MDSLKLIYEKLVREKGEYVANVIMKDIAGVINDGLGEDVVALNKIKGEDGYREDNLIEPVERPDEGYSYIKGFGIKSGISQMEYGQIDYGIDEEDRMAGTFREVIKGPIYTEEDYLFGTKHMITNLMREVFINSNKLSRMITKQNFKLRNFNITLTYTDVLDPKEVIFDNMIISENPKFLYELVKDNNVPVKYCKGFNRDSDIPKELMNRLGLTYIEERLLKEKTDFLLKILNLEVRRIRAIIKREDSIDKETMKNILRREFINIPESILQKQFTTTNNHKSKILQNRGIQLSPLKMDILKEAILGEEYDTSYGIIGNLMVIYRIIRKLREEKMDLRFIRPEDANIEFYIEYYGNKMKAMDKIEEHCLRPLYKSYRERAIINLLHKTNKVEYLNPGEVTVKLNPAFFDRHSVLMIHDLNEEYEKCYKNLRRFNGRI